MDEYIKREALIAHIKNLPTWWADAGGVYGRSMKYPEGMFDCEDVISSVENAPVADVAPVVHGRWDLQRKGDWISVFVCSVCGRGETIAESGSYNSQLKMPKKYPYCHCGAKMDGGTENAAD